MGAVFEVFSGIQGEGLFVGCRQIFVRLCGCNLACDFCDTEASQGAVETCRIEQTPGLRDFVAVDNPIAAADISDYVRRLDVIPGRHHSVAITGGEPLAQPDLLVELARDLKAMGFRTFLETNGSLPDVLPGVLPDVDIVSMDIKLASAIHGLDLLSLQETFLRIASSKQTFLKVVVTAGVTLVELLRAAAMVASVDAEIPVVLQPVTPIREVRAPSPEQVLQWQAECGSLLRDVRVIPQCHKMIGQM